MTPELSRGKTEQGGGGFSDEQMEATMGRLLQIGVVSAASVVLIGGIMYLLTTHGRPNYRVFRPHSVTLLHPMKLIDALLRRDPDGVIDLGILLLVATPIGRVVFAVVAFARERDKLYVVVSLIVLSVLLYGMLQGA